MIHFKDVEKTFRKQRILESVSLDIQAGERIALVGSNGAGKTTLMRCLLGEYVHAGEILVDGLNPRSQRTRVLSRIGFVPQLPPPLKMPVRQLVEFSTSVRNGRTEHVAEVAEQLGLDIDAFAGQSFIKLSGGQKQKLLIAIALGRETDILVMDEPAANLDPAARLQFFDLLAQRQDRSVMLISSHRLSEVATLVNRVLELDQGRIILDDKVEDVGALDDLLDCVVEIGRPEDAFSKAIRQWDFESDDEGRTWQGRIAGPDRLRFLGLLSRYAGLVTSLRMNKRIDDTRAVGTGR